MPYTISHVAAVLPFSRWLARWRMLSATIIGSMVPDIGYILPEQPDRGVSHSALSLVTFSLPLGLACFWIFQGLMKRPLLCLLPDQAYMRWRDCGAPAPLGSVRQWLLAACGVLFGAVTHLAWDGFTHEGARGMRMMPELSDWVIEVHGHHLIGAGLLQGGSSVIGLAIVVAVLAYSLRRGTPQTVAPRELSRAQRRRWVLLFALVVISATIGFDLLIARTEIPNHPLRANANIVAVALLRGLAFAALSISIALQRYLAYRGSGNASTSEV